MRRKIRDVNPRSLAVEDFRVVRVFRGSPYPCEDGIFSFNSRGKLLILGHGFKTDSRSGARDAGRHVVVLPVLVQRIRDFCQPRPIL